MLDGQLDEVIGACIAAEQSLQLEALAERAGGAGG